MGECGRGGVFRISNALAETDTGRPDPSPALRRNGRVGATTWTSGRVRGEFPHLGGGGGDHIGVDLPLAWCRRAFDHPDPSTRDLESDAQPRDSAGQRQVGGYMRTLDQMRVFDL